VPPRLPGGEEVDSCAEAGFEDHEARAAAPSLRQLIASQKDVTSLRRAAGGAVVDVVERLRIRYALLGKAQSRRSEWDGHGLIVKV